MRRVLALLILATIVAAGAARTQDRATPARELFAAVDTPAPLVSQSIGPYSGGCLAGGVALPADGPNWEAMRLERNRNWGHPSMIAYLERFATDAAALEEWPGILIGDISQPRGGPMPGAHVSHQTGLDVDLWYMAMPEQRLTVSQQAELGAASLIIPGSLEVDQSRWNDGIARLIRRAASYPEVARIFVHPGIKQMLCETAGVDRSWLRVIRPWYGHDDHFHVRLNCPAGETNCVSQAPPPEGDGCGVELAWWLGPEPWRPPEGPPQPPPPAKTLVDLPSACSMVLTAGATPVPPLPLARPQ